MKVIYEPVNIEISDFKKVQALIDEVPAPKALVTTAQYLEAIKTIHGCALKGQVLGCDAGVLKKFKGPNVIYLGTGRFHPLIIKFSFPEIKVFVINPETMKKTMITEKDVYVFRSRIAAGLDALEHAQKIGIIVSTKTGQFMMSTALSLKERFEKQGRKVYIFLFDNINPDEFLNHEVEVLINTACPRIGLDDASSYPVPVINHDFVK